MTQGTGLAPFAWIFMLLSMGAVTTLMLWCFYRILKSPGSYSQPEIPSPPERSAAD